MDHSGQDRKAAADERYADEWSPYRSDLPRIDAIVRLVGSGRRVLDIGCYSGLISERLAQRNNRVSAIDLSSDAVRRARAKGIDAYEADIEKNPLPFPRHSFEAIVAAEVIEHLFDTDAFLERVKEYLAPAGALVLTTPNLATLGRRLMLLMGKNPLIEVSCRGDAAGHIRYFVKESLFTLLNAHGFTITDFTSDVINFNNRGNLFCVWPAKLLPTWGKSLIVRATPRNTR